MGACAIGPSGSFTVIGPRPVQVEELQHPPAHCVEFLHLARFQAEGDVAVRVLDGVVCASERRQAGVRELEGAALTASPSRRPPLDEAGLLEAAQVVLHRLGADEHRFGELGLCQGRAGAEVSQDPVLPRRELVRPQRLGQQLLEMTAESDERPGRHRFNVGRTNRRPLRFVHDRIVPMNQDSVTTGGPVLVTGGTGDIGGEVVRRLVAAGVEVHALHRQPEQAAALTEVGAHPVLGRLGDEAELRRAMSGVDRLFLLTPPIAQQVDFDRQLISLAEQARLKHVVRISASDSNPRSPVPWARAHSWGDQRLAATELDWTVLRPGAFMQNLIQQADAIRRGVLPHAAGRGRFGWIDNRDVARVAARVLLDGPAAHRHATYFLTGKDSLTFTDVAERLTTKLGRRVRAIALPKPAYVSLLRAAGVDAFTARGLGAQFADVVRRNVDTDTTWEVQRLTGVAPRGLDQWIEEHHHLL
jgi:uncharacterized protein YbjT (DUF2867 family)